MTNILLLIILQCGCSKSHPIGAKSPHWTDRNKSLNEIAERRPITRDNVNLIVQSLFDAEPLVRSHAAEILGQLPIYNDIAIPHLIAALSDSDWRVKSQAARSLGMLCERAKCASLRLHNLLMDKSQEVEVRRSAAFALSEIGSENLESLASALKDEDDEIRSWVLSALGKYPGLPDDIIKTMTNLAWSDPDETNRIGAVVALGRIARNLPPDGKAKAALLDIINREYKNPEEYSVVIATANELFIIEPANVTYHEVLLKAIEEDNLHKRVETLEYIMETARTHGNRLQAYLKDFLLKMANGKNTEASKAVFSYLGDSGDRARPLVQALKEIAQVAKDANVREFAQRAAEALTR